MKMKLCSTFHTGGLEEVHFTRIFRGRSDKELARKLVTWLNKMAKKGYRLKSYVARVHESM